MRSDRGRRVTAEALHAYCVEVLVAVGATTADAGIVADSLIDADLRGLDQHGVPARLGNYVARAQAGGIRTDAVVTTVTDGDAMVALDAGDGFGQVAAQRAVAIVIERAQRLSIAMVGVRNGNHLGALGYWSRTAADAGLVGFSLSGAKARIAPWGTAQPLLSTNPWSIAFPAAGEHPPLVVDLSAGVVLSSALEEAAAAAEQIPLGWALDTAGRPTSDPVAGMRGAMLAFGGVKGSALTLAMEALATVVTGGEASVRVPDLLEVGSPQRLGQLFVAFRADGLIDISEYRARMAELLGGVATAPPAAGFDAARVPGSRGESVSAERARTGIPIEYPEALASVGAQFDVAPPWA